MEILIGGLDEYLNEENVEEDWEEEKEGDIMESVRESVSAPNKPNLTRKKSQFLNEKYSWLCRNLFIFIRLRFEFQKKRSLASPIPKKKLSVNDDNEDQETQANYIDFLIHKFKYSFHFSLFIHHSLEFKLDF